MIPVRKNPQLNTLLVPISGTFVVGYSIKKRNINVEQCVIKTRKV